MGKITRHGGPSVREFQSPATVLRQRGKLGPYGGEARVETFAAVSEADAVPAPADDVAQARGEVDADPVPDSGGQAGAGSGEPTTAEIRAWARRQGFEVADSGKLSAEIVEAYRDAHGEG